MPRRIAILADAVADQIAAGEVVERPASAVKELMENALDAGAKRVRVSAEQGGKTLIEVSDDGSGMGREDAVLALDRHATSKIRSAADLVGVRTFGFRGEALAAIASVSRLLLVTAEEPGEGTEVDVVGGRIERVDPIARQQGTTVSVRGLFFNTPARRKFFRSLASETRAIQDVFATLALTHPEVGFELELDGRTRLTVPAGQTADERLAAVWGSDLAGTLIPVQYASGGFRVEGFAQRPGDAKPTGRRTQLFINGRPFRDPFLIRAAESGYRSAIHPGDRPSLFLHLETAADSVDVNVHPAKLEVRFRERLAAERAVEEAVRDALGKWGAIVPVGQWRPGPSMTTGVNNRWSGEGGGTLSTELPADLATELFAPLAAPDTDARGGFTAPLVQLFDSYLVYQAPEGLVFVDQHSAHERVLYEEVMARISSGEMPAQRLLLPLMLEFTDEELEAAEAHREMLSLVGFEAEPFGGRTLALQAVPSPHPRFDAGRCFRELISDLARGRFGGWANPLERFAASYACHAAVKAGDPLDSREQRELMTRLLGCTLPAHDVHGRATIVQLPREELERRFGRR